MTALHCKPIGYFYSACSEKYMLPRQSELCQTGGGCIVLEPNCNYEHALEDLIGFERIWLLYWFHRNQTWKPKVTTPRPGPKRGVFGTRSPHRPNPIGLSCVQLLGLEGRTLRIAKNDLLDGTPILDIKPYLSYADAFPKASQGWAEETIATFSLHWSELALRQRAYIEAHSFPDLRLAVETRLRENPYPFPNHRIKQIDSEQFVLACKTWRIQYRISELEEVLIERICSGYTDEMLNGVLESRWGDVEVHRQFNQVFAIPSVA